MTYALDTNMMSYEEDDILQAGYCINHGYTLVTHNLKHFEGIPGLQTIDWVKD
jgi:predicted nucleic acid-binding protein